MPDFDSRLKKAIERGERRGDRRAQEARARATQAADAAAQAAEAAARELGIHKATLFKKIRKLGIVLPEISYTPDAQVEGGWNAIQLAKAMAEVAAPVVALILAFLGFLALFRKQK